MVGIVGTFGDRSSGRSGTISSVAARGFHEQARLFRYGNTRCPVHRAIKQGRLEA
jgi:hypothetical protein